MQHVLHLQRSAVFRERGAEEGVDGVKNHADDVFLQNGIGKTLFSFITDLQSVKKPNISTKGQNRGGILDLMSGQVVFCLVSYGYDSQILFICCFAVDSFFLGLSLF